MYLEELIGTVELENKEIEYKAKLNRDDVVSWLKTVCGFANSSGGVFFIGVEDKTNKLIGFDRKGADNERNFFNNQINERVSPRPEYEINFINYQIRGSERFIIKVQIEESRVKPVILKYNGVPSIYMRRSGMTNGASYEEIINMSIKSHNASFDTLTSDREYSKDDFTDLFGFCEERNDGSNVLSDKYLASIGFFDEEGRLKNGAVLFADDYTGEKTEVQCSVFPGFNKGSERIVSVNKYKGNITNSINFMLEFVRQRMNHSIIKTDDGRINVDAYPQRALFEGIINAVAHRDYYFDGTQIQVDIFKDRLEITSPGSFFQHETVKKTYDLSSLISKRRNELICNILVACNAMEAAGTGFEKIEEDYSLADKKHKPFICAESDHFTLVLPDMTYQEGVKDDGTPNLSFFPVRGGSKHDKRILEYCYFNAHNAKEISEYLGISNSSYLRNTILKKLVSNSLLHEEKNSDSVYYRTNRDLVSID